MRTAVVVTVLATVTQQVEALLRDERASIDKAYCGIAYILPLPAYD
jgi:hypothetical protein